VAAGDDLQVSVGPAHKEYRSGRGLREPEEGSFQLLDDAGLLVGPFLEVEVFRHQSDLVDRDFDDIRVGNVRRQRLLPLGGVGRGDGFGGPGGIFYPFRGIFGGIGILRYRFTSNGKGGVPSHHFVID